MSRTDLTTYFIEICKAGDIRGLMNLINTTDKALVMEFILYENYKGFLLACENGFVDIVDQIICFVKSVSKLNLDDYTLIDEAIIPIFDENDYLAFRLALTNKHIDVIERILQEEYLFHYCLHIIGASTKFIEFIWQSHLKNIIYEIFSQACETNLESVKKILDVLPEGSHYLLYEYNDIYISDKWIIKERSAFRTACANGNLDVVKLLWCLFDYSLKQKIIKLIMPSYFIIVAKNGHFHILEYLLNILSSTEQLHCLSYEDYNTFVYAADRGNEEIVELVWKYLPKKLRYLPLSASNFAVYRLAYKNQHVHMCSLLESFACEEGILKSMKEAKDKSVTSTFLKK